MKNSLTSRKKLFLLRAPRDENNKKEKAQKRHKKSYKFAFNQIRFLCFAKKAEKWNKKYLFPIPIHKESSSVASRFEIKWLLSSKALSMNDASCSGFYRCLHGLWCLPDEPWSRPLRDLFRMSCEGSLVDAKHKHKAHYQDQLTKF